MLEIGFCCDLPNDQLQTVWSSPAQIPWEGARNSLPFMQAQSWKILCACSWFICEAEGAVLRFAILILAESNRICEMNKGNERAIPMRN